MLSGKNAVITGTNRGIGKATVELFAKNHCNIWACARSKNEEFEKELNRLSEEFGVWIEPVYFDFTDPEEMKSAVMQIRSKKEKIDILVNNAGIEQKAGFFQMTSMDEIRKIFEVNFFAQIQFTQYISKLMCRTGCGSIINLVSVAAEKMTEGYIAYSASKAALLSATKTMAAELMRNNIRVNAVSPGIAQTDMAMGLSNEARENTVKSSLMDRIADPMEIANTILFLASDMSSYITGQVVKADGGM